MSAAEAPILGAEAVAQATATGAGATPPAAAVDWREALAALRGSGEWRQLLADLAAVPGGPSVVVLLQRAIEAVLAAAAFEVQAHPASAAQAASGNSGSHTGAGAAGSGSTHGPAGLAGSISCVGGGGGGGTAMLAQAVQQVVWEKLHTGEWHAVPLVWRDAYAAACVLAAAVGLPESKSGSGSEAKIDVTAEIATEAAAAKAIEAAAAAPGVARAGPAAVTQGISRTQGAVVLPGQVAVPQQEGSLSSATGGSVELGRALSAALWHLDMATIMGGPLLRPLVDALIDTLQHCWQQLHGVAATRAPLLGAPAELQQQEEQQQVAGVHFVCPTKAHQQQQQGEEEGVEQPQQQQQFPMQEGRVAGAAALAGNSSQAEAAPPAKRRRLGGSPAAAEAAAEVALLPPWSLGPRGTPIATAELPSLEAFWLSYMSPGTPVVISGAMEDWPALRRWADPAYLIAVAGPRTVPVEVGEHYLADQWGQQLMTLQRFVQQHILAPAPPGGGYGGGSATSGQGGSGREADACHQHQDADREQQRKQGEGSSPQLVARRQAGGKPAPDAQQAFHSQQAQHPPQQAQRRAYLAQHPLFDQIPALAGDIREPPYCCLGEREGEVESVNAWFGPAGTVTPLHTDPHSNLLCQVVGRKYVRLYSPDCTAAMYPRTEGMHTNSAQVEASAPDLERFPLFADAPFQDCVLEAGQMLFIPRGWWHHVQSTTVSFSVSFWF